MKYMCRQASSVFWLLSGDLFSDAEWSSHVVTAHFFCSALCHPAAPALLQRLTAIVINSWELCNADDPARFTVLKFFSSRPGATDFSMFHSGQSAVIHSVGQPIAVAWDSCLFENISVAHMKYMVLKPF